ncbi:MAG: dehydrogenase [Porticoccaceae bacterium]|nr:MAG: dehydrogenase [Porticoccaceae bacterium]
MERTFDTLIVGAGSAGCVLANRLSADPARRVLLLEAGGEDRWLWFHIPVGYLFAMGNPRADWCYQTTPQPGLNGRALPYPRGKVLGGSSAINGMIYMRGQRQDYDGWGLPGWDWASVLPLFRKSEDYFGGESEFHGVGGELRVERQRLSWEVLERWREACIQYGIPPRDDFNTGDNEGVGYFHVNQRRGLRLSAKRAFLDPVRSRPNLEVRTGVLVDRLIWRDGRVEGVEYLRQGRRERVAAGQVILAAGAVATPCILQRSGIGDEARLRAAGLPCRLHLPGVGAALQDHLQIRVQFRIEGAVTLNCLMKSLRGRAKMALEYLLWRSGPLSMAPSQLGAFLRSAPEVERPDLEYHVQPMSAERLGRELHPFPGITASICNLRPTSRGRVDAVGPDPRDPPRIDPNYLATEEDRRLAVRAIEITREIARQPAVASLRPVEIKPGAACATPEALVRAAGDIATTIFHPTCTCRMGRDDDPEAVTGPDLRLRGFANLFVADASVFPSIPSGNTHAPTVMVAEKLARDLSR